MKKTAIIVHGGAGPDSQFIRQNLEHYKKGLEEALEAGYSVLEKNGTAVDAVEAAVRSLENNLYFNCARGSALNDKGEVDMCASVMDGKNLDAGAVALVKNVKHPVSLARMLMQESNCVYMGGEEAVNYARKKGLEMAPDAYFITNHQYEAYAEKKASAGEIENPAGMPKPHGTVGAVALDADGNLAAATSTGGTTCCQAGRIGDSSMIGVGNYANNRTCAISATGDGEYIIRSVLAHSISSSMAYKKQDVKKACKEIIHTEHKQAKADLGVIGLDAEGNVAVEFNSERMHRGWKIGNEKAVIRIYKD